MGISSLKVVGKVVARVVQNQLQEPVQKLLLNCSVVLERVGVVFTIWQMSEKAVEQKFFFIFVDS